MATENEQLLEEQARLREKEDRKFMRQALTQAKKAAAIDEVPIGCVIVCDGKVIARGYNRRNIESSVLGHAELAAMKKASKKLGDWRLEGCTMYVTLEPCQMCAGAIVQSRMRRVIIGSMNPKAGCAGSVLNLLQMQQFNHQVEITRGVLEETCSSMLSAFFRELRQRKKKPAKSE
jgi:tRNA(adenine34) deaminase